MGKKKGRLEWTDSSRKQARFVSDEDSENMCTFYISGYDPFEDKSEGNKSHGNRVVKVWEIIAAIGFVGITGLILLVACVYALIMIL